MSRLRVLDLFSGIGGFSLGLERTGGFETVAFCEIETFPRRVLAKNWPDKPCFPDVRTLKGTDIDGPIDLICGGYPCQPFSTAGKRQGKEDDRHLWPEFMRLVAELRPAWVIGENVAGHISMGLDDVLADLEAEGYTCRTFVIPACAVGASHRRDRVWTVAYADSAERRAQRGACGRLAQQPDSISQGQEGAGRSEASGEDVANAAHMQRNGGGNHTAACDGQVPEFGAGSGADDVADTNDTRSQRRSQTGNTQRRGDNQGPARGAEPRVGGMADGFSCWMDEPGERVKAGVKDRAPRLKALGNAVHPDIPMMLGAAILQAEAAA